MPRSFAVATMPCAIGCSDWLSADAAKRNSSASSPSASTAMSTHAETGPSVKVPVCRTPAVVRSRAPSQKAGTVADQQAVFLALSVVADGDDQRHGKPERMRNTR